MAQEQIDSINHTVSADLPAQQPQKKTRGGSLPKAERERLKRLKEEQDKQKSQKMETTQAPPGNQTQLTAPVSKADDGQSSGAGAPPQTPPPFSGPMPGADFDPLTDEPVKQRAYTNPGASGPIPPGDIPEPSFQPPKIDINTNPAPTEKAEDKTPPSPINPAVSGLSDKDKQTAAEQLVDVLLSGYEKLHQAGRWYVNVPEEDLVEMALDGKISMDLQIPVNDDGTQFVTLKEFIDQYNKQSAEAIQVSPKFKEEVRPAMIRVFIKHGWGLTDEQFLAYKFGEDVMVKMSMVIGFKKSINRTIGLFSKVYQQQKDKSVTPPPPPAPSPVQGSQIPHDKQPPPSQSQKSSGIEDATIMNDNEPMEPEERIDQ